MFNVYSNIAEKDVDSQSFELVESGLSEGEVRQSILDRLRNEIRFENVGLINKNLESFTEKVFMLSDVSNFSNSERTEEEVGQVIYDADNSDIVKHWFFEDETIIVKEED